MRVTTRQLAGAIWAMLAVSLLAVADVQAADEAEVREAERAVLEAEATVREMQREILLERARQDREMQFQRVAQDSEERELERALALEEQERVREQAREEQELAREEQELAREAELEARLDEAQEQLEEAARHVAELSSELAGDAMAMALEGLRSIAPRPMLGINISSTTDQKDGVEVFGVTPGGPADEAGLKVGDVLVKIDSLDLAGGGPDQAEDRLSEYMQNVGDGQEVTVTFLRDDDEQQVVVVPRDMNPLQLAFSMGDGFDFDFVDPEIPENLETRAFQLRLGHAGPWGDMELVSLSPDLARYFGTEEGLLVIRAPEDTTLKLLDGDVILDIDGRKPTSPGHAMRILRSYEVGETFGLRIVRDKKRMTLDLQMPSQNLSQQGHDRPPIHPSRTGRSAIRRQPEST